MEKRPLTHVLYADDEPDMRMLVQMALEAVGGLQMTVCESGIAALEALKTQRPQLVILDSQMPGIDGLETFKRIRDNPLLTGLPVAFMTAKPESEHGPFLAAGAVGVIAKPFDPMTLADQVRALWGKINV